MRSIDNLREWANGLHGVYINQIDHTITITTGWDAPPDMDSVSLRDHVNGILDGIEREVAELTDERDLLKIQWEAGVDFDQRLEACADNREDVTLFGVDYTPLPVDADGVPIHVDDVMEWPDGKTFDVVGIGDGTLFYVEGDDDALADWTGASTKRHHYSPTVEDVLLDACRAYHSLMVESMSDVSHDMLAPTEVIAEYAAKLQLKEG